MTCLSHAVISGENPRNGLRIDTVFLRQDARKKRLSRVSLSRTGTVAWEKNRAGIQCFVHKVNRAATNLHTMSKSLILRVESGKRGQQRRMDVQNARWKLPIRTPR